MEDEGGENSQWYYVYSELIGHRMTAVVLHSWPSERKMEDEVVGWIGNGWSMAWTSGTYLCVAVGS